MAAARRGLPVASSLGAESRNAPQLHSQLRGPAASALQKQQHGLNLRRSHRLQVLPPSKLRFVEASSLGRQQGTGPRRNGFRTRVAAPEATSAQPQAPEAISLPINYYEMLGVLPEAPRETIELMCETKLDQPPTEGFSIAAITGRAEILEAARETLLDPELKSEYDADMAVAKLQFPKLNAIAVDVPLPQTPGLLCLLQECGGRASIVAEAGLALLAMWDEKDQAGRCDIALATALAYSDLAREAMTATPPSVTQGCELLEGALGVLRAEGGDNFAIELQQNINDTLLEMGPTCLLELLALPLGPENETARREGIQGMRDLLWKKGLDGKPLPRCGSYEREVFMKESFLRMTTSELVDFFNAAPTDVDAGLLEVYWVALAYLGRAFFYKRPEDVLHGQALLIELEDSPSFQALVALQGGPKAALNAGATLPGTDVPASLAVERAMCALLLGRIEESKKWLGLDTWPPSGDLALAQFVYGNSPGVPDTWLLQLQQGEDAVAGEGPVSQRGGEGQEEILLPGLCYLLELWLREVVSMRFRDTCTEPVRLETYFDSPEVGGFLEKLEQGQAEGVGKLLRGLEVGSFLRSGAASAMGAMKAALKTLSSAAPLKTPVSPSEGASGEPWVKKAGGVREEEGGLWLPFQEVFTSFLGGTAPADTAKDRTARDLQMRRQAVDSSEARAQRRNSQSGGALVPTSQSGSSSRALTRLGGPDGVAALTRVVGGLAAVAASALLVYQGTTVMRRTLASAPGATSAASSVASKGKQSGAEQGAFALLLKTKDSNWGFQLIRRWQQVKAAALGPKHQVQRLREVLEGPMLDLWEERAREVQSNGWHWEYEFLNLTVDSALVSSDRKTAVLQATIQEAARLVDSKDPKHNDSYKSTYKARYELKQTPQGWKIIGGTVLR